MPIVMVYIQMAMCILCGLFDLMSIFLLNIFIMYIHKYVLS